MAFLSHLSPNKIKIAPTTRRSTSSGTHCTSATPNTPTNAAKISSAAPVPTSALRQLIVMPTTSTIVNASTHSTNDAANAEVKTIHSIEPHLCFGGGSGAAKPPPNKHFYCAALRAQNARSAAQ